MSGLLLDTDPAAFACTVLESLGWPARPLRAASGWSNHVWLAPAHVVRISSGRFRDAYAHELAVLKMLPDAVPHAQAVAYGRAGRREWMVLQRVPGRPLTQVWAGMSEFQRQLLHFPPRSGSPDPWGHLQALLESGNRWARF